MPHVTYRVSAAEVWCDGGIPRGDELQSFAPRYELSLSCGVPTGTIEEYQSFLSRYDLGLSCVDTADTIDDYHQVTSYRVLFIFTKGVSPGEVQLIRSRNTTRCHVIKFLLTVRIESPLRWCSGCDRGIPQVKSYRFVSPYCCVGTAGYI